MQIPVGLLFPYPVDACSRIELGPWAMTNELLKLAKLFRLTAIQLRRLADGPIPKNRDLLIAIEAYLYRNQLRTKAAFPRDQCLETANLLEAFADRY